MGYRINSHPKPKPRRTAVDIATPAKLYVHNGTLAHFAFPCWYQEMHKPVPAHHHDHHWHDHVGWPSPDHPDHICQLWAPDRHCCSIGHRHECSRHCEHYIDMANVFPIHLREEGYSSALVKWATDNRQPPTGITATASIDTAEDWVVRLDLDIKDPAALQEPQKYLFTVFVHANEDGGLNERNDIVVLAELNVLPSSY